MVALMQIGFNFFLWFSKRPKKTCQKLWVYVYFRRVLRSSSVDQPSQFRLRHHWFGHAHLVRGSLAQGMARGQRHIDGQDGAGELNPTRPVTFVCGEGSGAVVVKIRPRHGNMLQRRLRRLRLLCAFGQAHFRSECCTSGRANYSVACGA